MGGMETESPKAALAWADDMNGSRIGCEPKRIGWDSHLLSSRANGCTRRLPLGWRSGLGGLCALRGRDTSGVAKRPRVQHFLRSLSLHAFGSVARNISLPLHAPLCSSHDSIIRKAIAARGLAVPPELPGASLSLLSCQGPRRPP
eukprot:4003934-Pleurochrysis_carterae.AAC.4